MYVDERRDLLDRLQHYMATTPPEKRCPYGKGVVLLKAKQHMGSCDAKPALLRKESELKKVEGERVLKRQRLDIEERFEQAKMAAQGFEALWRETHTPHLSTGFREGLKTAVSNELLYG